jgi:hypothetical protein
VSRGNRTIGYMVTWDRDPTHASRRKDVEGVLFLSHVVTLFPTRRAAQQAIRKSRRYAIENALPWPDKYNVLRVEVPHD